MDAKEISGLLKQAANYVVVKYHYSPWEAAEWIQQEARAKRASLQEVAEAVLTGRTTRYHHDAPV